MEDKIIPKKKYTPEFKTKIIIAILQGDKELNAICAENNLNPNMVRKWKQEFLANANLTFGAKAEHKAALIKENDLKRNNDRMLKTIGQLDFLQDCFRIVGEPIPKMPKYDSKE